MMGAPLSTQDLPHNSIENSLHLSPALDLLGPVFFVFLLLSFLSQYNGVHPLAASREAYMESKLVDILSEMASFYTDP